MPIKRRVLGVILAVARTLGWAMIALAILGLPGMRFLMGHLAVTFGLLSSMALGLAGIAWLIGMELFLRFFDQYLSRN